MYKGLSDNETALEVDILVHKLRELEIDGETMEYIVKSLGFEEYLHHWLIMKNPIVNTLDILKEKTELSK